MKEDMPKTCKGCKYRENDWKISPCDRYSLGTHQACYDKMDEDTLKMMGTNRCQNQKTGNKDY